MNYLFSVVVVVQVLSALVIVGLVLLQHGKGADMGAAFGSGASGSLFGATGSSNFLSKSTAVAAAVFFSATLALSYMGAQRHASGGAGVVDNLPVNKEKVAPKPASAPASAPAATGAASAAPAAAAASASGQAGQIPK